jgi:hypothetical protein
MPVPSLTVLASLLQIHGPGATIQSDHQGIDALLGDIRGQISQEGVIPDKVIPDKPVVTQVYFRRGGFVRGAGYGGGAFRRGGYVGPAGGFRRGGFVRGY